MFDNLDLALAEYDEVLARRQREAPALHSRSLAEWIRGDAMHAIEDLAARPDFREAARWPLERLVPGAKGVERERIDAVDAALVDHAAALVRRAQNAIDPPRPPDPPADPRAPGHGLAAGIPADLKGAEFIASRPWQDLVSSQDYFWPTGSLNLRGGEKVPISLDLMPMFNASLRRPGDLVVAMLLVRVKYWTECLAEFRHGRVPIGASGDERSAEQAAVKETGTRLRLEVAALEEAFGTDPQVRLRGACISLVQAYAEFHPRPDLAWLRGVDPLSGKGRLNFWLQHGETMVASTIAAALSMASESFGGKLPPEVVLKEAARSHQLVLAQGFATRFMFWKGEPAGPEQWEKHPVLWNLLWALACRAKEGHGIDHSFFGTKGRAAPGKGEDVVSATALKSQVNRLKALLPPEMRPLIKVTGGTYRLSVESGELFLCEVVEDGVIERAGSMTLQQVRALLEQG